MSRFFFTVKLTKNIDQIIANYLQKHEIPSMG